MFIETDKTKRFEKKLYNFLSSSIRGSLVYEDVRKTTLINIFALFGIFYLLFYTYRMSLSGDYKLSIIYIFIVGVIVTMQIFLRRSRKILISSHIFVFSLFCLELYFLIRNGSTILNVKSYYVFPGIYWYYTFPLLSLFLLGRKIGSIYNIILISITISLFSIDSELTKLYDMELKVRFLSVYSAVFFFAFFFESIRLVTYKAFLRMQYKNIEYSSRIIEKNKDLKKKNEDLLMLTEEVHVQMDYLRDLNVMLEVKNNKIVSQNQQLEIQSNEISNQRDQLLVQKQNITDSILYASYIQKALLPNEGILKENFSDFFILYKPRDIIGGDFYYVKKIQDTLVIAVADCTGHGVPGALLSMLGISYLNEIIHSNELSETNTILDEMRNKIKLALNQSNQNRETKDGMDMALIAIDLKCNILKYSGANNPVYILRNNEIIELKADKMPIGIQPRERPNFTNLEFQLFKNDCIYLFTDGYADQLDDQNLRKFSLKNFQKLLLNISAQNMNDQRIELERIIENWKVESDQTDDILVLGVRI